MSLQQLFSECFNDYEIVYIELLYFSTTYNSLHS